MSLIFLQLRLTTPPAPVLALFLSLLPIITTVAFLKRTSHGACLLFKGTTADSMKPMCFNWGQGHPLLQISELGPKCTSLFCAQDPLFISIYPSSHGPATSEPPAGLSCQRNHTLLYVCTQSMWSCLAVLRGPEATWGWRLYHVHLYPQSRALCLLHSRPSFVQRKSNNFKMLITTKE